MTGGRRRSREECLKALYRMQVTGDGAAEAIDSLRSELGSDPALLPEVADYAAHLVTLVDVHGEEIDRLVAGALSNWDPSRVAQTDRAVLRMAVAELLHCPEVPARVAIDEAIEIAKRYGTNASGRFVNGVLDSIARAQGSL
jgi:transcription antitermination protein NusB